LCQHNLQLINRSCTNVRYVEMKTEQQQLLLSPEVRTLLKDEASLPQYRNSMSQVADEILREGLLRRIKERETRSDDYSKLMDAVKNARQI
jgi:hypothetical protein